MSADQLPIWIFSIGTAMTVVAGLLATPPDDEADWAVEAPSPEPGR